MILSEAKTRKLHVLFLQDEKKVHMTVLDQDASIQLGNPHEIACCGEYSVFTLCTPEINHNMLYIRGTDDSQDRITRTESYASPEAASSAIEGFINAIESMDNIVTIASSYRLIVEFTRNHNAVEMRVLEQDESIPRDESWVVESGSYTVRSAFDPEINESDLFIRGRDKDKDDQSSLYEYDSEDEAVAAVEGFKTAIESLNVETSEAIATQGGKTVLRMKFTRNERIVTMQVLEQDESLRSVGSPLLLANTGGYEVGSSYTPTFSYQRDRKLYVRGEYSSHDNQTNTKTYGTEAEAVQAVEGFTAAIESMSKVWANPIDTIAEAADHSLKVAFRRVDNLVQARIVHQAEGLRGIGSVGEVDGYSIRASSQPELQTNLLYIRGTGTDMDDSVVVCQFRTSDDATQSVVGLTKAIQSIGA